MSRGFRWGASLGVMAGFFTLGTGAAGAVEDVSVGVLAHNIQVTDSKNANKEDGPTIDAQATWGRIETLSVIGAPRLYVSLSPNVAGDASFAAVGLEWRILLGQAWSIDPSFGYAVHDGEVSNPFPNGDPRASAFTDQHVLLGSRDLFRSGVAITRRLGASLSAQALYVHYSHGQILGSGRNQGMDQMGVRLRYALD